MSEKENYVQHYTKEANNSEYAIANLHFFAKGKLQYKKKKKKSRKKGSAKTFYEKIKKNCDIKERKLRKGR